MEFKAVTIILSFSFIYDREELVELLKPALEAIEVLIIKD